MALLLTGEPITGLMYRLDNEQNLNLFYLIKFVSRDHSPNTYQSQEQYHALINSYGEIVKKINNSDYKEKVSDIPKDFRLEYVDKLPGYLDMLNYFNVLPSRSQQNIINLAWFILYYKKFGLNDTEGYHYQIWQSYCTLIEKIKSF